MKKICVFALVFFAGVANAAQFIEVTRSNAVIAYKDPTPQSKIIHVFNEGDVVQSVEEKAGWYKVKVPYQQGSFVYGWIVKSSPFIASTDASSSRAKSTNAGPPKPTREPVKTTKRKVADNSDDSDSDSDSENTGNNYLRVFGGPVYSLYKYGAFQYRLGLSYAFPVSKNVKFGIPVSFSTGDGFRTIFFGIEGMYSFEFGSFLITPRLALGYESFSGKGKSFQSGTVEFGPMIEYAFSEHFMLGVEPMTMQTMLVNSTDSIDKIPYNVRGQTLILLKGRW